MLGRERLGMGDNDNKVDICCFVERVYVTKTILQSFNTVRLFVNINFLNRLYGSIFREFVLHSGETIPESCAKL